MRTYKQKYGHSTPDAPVEIINLRLIAIGKVEKPIDYSKMKKENIINKTSKQNREIIFNGKKFKTQIINRSLIKKHDIYKGPLVIEEESATTVVPPNYSLVLDKMGNLIIKKIK